MKIKNIISRGSTIATEYYINGVHRVPLRKIHFFSGNCKMTSICYAKKLLFKDKKKEQEIFDIVFKYSKKLILVDIQRCKRNSIKKLFLNNNFEVFKNTPYTSTNESLMNIIIFKKIL